MNLNSNSTLTSEETNRETRLYNKDLRNWSEAEQIEYKKKKNRGYSKTYRQKQKQKKWTTSIVILWPWLYQSTIPKYYDDDPDEVIRHMMPDDWWRMTKKSYSCTLTHYYNSLVLSCTSQEPNEFNASNFKLWRYPHTKHQKNNPRKSSITMKIVTTLLISSYLLQAVAAKEYRLFERGLCLDTKNGYWTSTGR